MRERSLVGSFEGARGLAALLVAVYHFRLLVPFGIAYPSAVQYGYLFVDLFFVLSGFVICASYEARLDTSNDFRTFAIRRFGRLFPLLIASTVAFIVAPDLLTMAKHAAIVLGHGNAFRNPQLAPYVEPRLVEIVATLTMTHGLGLFDKAVLNFASWSISTEFYTYLVFAGICLLVSGRRRIVLFSVLSLVAFAVTCWASLVAHQCVATQDCMNITYDYGMPRCLTSFFLGCLVHHGARRMRAQGSLLQTVALLALCGVFAAIGRVPEVAFACPLVFALLILSLSSDRGYLARLLNTAPAQLLGRRSYSIYLMHPVLIEVVGGTTHHFSGPTAGLAILAVYIVALVMVSGLTYRYVEAPFRDRFNRWARQQEVAPVTTSAA